MSCSSLRKIVLPSTLRKLDEHAFEGCSKLESVVFSERNANETDKESLEILQKAFYDCPSLTEINLPNGLKKIDYLTFSGCESLKSLEIPDSVVAVEIGAFFGCESLESVVFPKNVEKIGEAAFYGCLSLSSLRLSERTRQIGKRAFGDCDSLAIHAPKGSYAERYAKENNLDFTPCEETALV